jgi:DNA-binding winged helix-turn-helix (wHTH) protein
MRIAFAEFILDTDERRLLAGARDVPLSPKGFDLLRVLIEQRPKALSKDELLACLWPDTFVSENNLATVVADLRAALRDGAHTPRFVRTVYAYGYAFAGEAVEQRPAPPVSDKGSCRWRLIHDHREIPLHQGENILGRTGPGIVVLESPTISRHHARLFVADDRATIEDLGSKNGTWVGTVPATAPLPVSHGDELRLGSIVLVVRYGWPASSTETVDRGRT